MKNTLSFAIIFTFSLIPIFVHSEKGFYGENLGLSLYSTIDSGNFTLQEKTLKVRLSENPTLGKFGKGCPGIDSVKDEPTRKEFLDNLEYGDYTELSRIINRSGKSISTETFQSLVLCLGSKYNDLKKRNERENTARITLSSIGLYTDGDIGNSDYDILFDIAKINSLIFSEELKYEGVVNKSKNTLKNFLAGKTPPPLFQSGITQLINTGSHTPLPNVNPVGNTGSTYGSDNNHGGNAPISGSPNLQSIIRGLCTHSGGGVNGVPDFTLDSSLDEDISMILRYGTSNTPIGEGYTPGENDNPQDEDENIQNSGNITKTGGTDFFHKMPCTSIFCIKVRMVGGRENLLGGGKNISIEGLLDKHHKILEPISESALRDEKMTNNSFSLPFFNLKLPKTIAGLRVYITNNPQITRRDKREETPAKKKEELERVRRCAFVSAGLSADIKRSNTLLGGGYMPSIAPTSENILNRSLPLGPQETVEQDRYKNCMDFLISGGRLSYYDSFSTDLTEIQAFTHDMLETLDEIMSIGKALNNKPVK